MDQSVLLDFFKALIVCCNADDNLTPAERGWCVGLRRRHRRLRGHPRRAAGLPGRDEVTVFFDRGLQWATAPRTVIYESIRACASDADYNQPEQDKIARMAALLDVGPDEVAELEQLYLDERALRAPQAHPRLPVLLDSTSRPVPGPRRPVPPGWAQVLSGG